MRTNAPNRRLRTVAAPAALALVLAFAFAFAGTAVAADGPSVAFSLKDSRITESSGLAASRAHPGVYWTHNDSDDGPYVYAVDSATGKTVARVTMRGIGTARDLEGISIGPDNQIYVGDIGDNLGGTWSKVWIYRIPEPTRLKDVTVDATQFTVQYREGPRDAESLMVHPKTGRVYIVSKNEDGGGLYAGPEDLSADGVNTFTRVADIDLWVTDGAFSPDGTRLAVRGYFGGMMYRWAGGAPTEIDSLSPPLQRQGESVTFTDDGRALMYGSEGGGSAVWRAPLSGDDLPESAATTTEPAAEPSGSSGSGAGGTSADSDKNNNVTLGLLTLAGATALVMAGRRALRRRG